MLNKSDKDFITKASKETREALEQINTTLNQLLQEVYGPPPERNNGLRGTVKELTDCTNQNKKDILVIQTEHKVQRRMNLAAVGTGITALVGLVARMLGLKL